MDPLQASMAGILIAREILHIINSQQEISEEKLATLIAANLIRIEAVKDVIKLEMEKYNANNS